MRDRKKILLYSHDSYGLGHLRRSQTIAHALLDAFPHYSVLIVTGSPVIGQFEWKQGVDFLRLPGITKLHNGEYETHHLNIDIQDLVALRAAIITQTISSFKPDLILVDKEPLGLRGELHAALTMAKAHKIPVILGLRDVLDEISALNHEWERKNIYTHLLELYQEIWVYGIEEMGSPLKGLPIEKDVEKITFFTGYLDRSGNGASLPPQYNLKKTDLEKPFLLGMVGGGGDGENLMDALLRLYEAYDSELLPIILILGPFMTKEAKKKFAARAEHLQNVETVFFATNIEFLLKKTCGIISMGGYNSFCEILSFDKPSLIYPRTIPRQEQYIRASRAQKEGLAEILDDSILENPDIFKEKLIKLPTDLTPSSQRDLDILLGGLHFITERVKTILAERDQDEFSDPANLRASA